MSNRKGKVLVRGAVRRNGYARGKAIENASPRYRLIARQLAEGISSGRFPIGSQIPTEFDICKELGISRFTAREAIRILVNEGLVVRRQRVGTMVVATPDEHRYRLSLSSLRDLLQYAQDTELRLLETRRVKLDRAKARDLRLPAGQQWIHAAGIRNQGRSPLCRTDVYINPIFRGVVTKLNKRKNTVYALLQKEYGVTIARVEQELRGVTLSAEDAAVLGATEADPALRIIRRYYDAEGQILEVSDNIHPSDRFSYFIQLTR